MSKTPAPRFPEAESYFVGDEYTNRERMLAGDRYVTDDPDDARIAAHAHTALHRFERTFTEGKEDCWDLLRPAIPRLGDKTHLLPPVHVNCGDNITVGGGTFVDYGFVALDVARISIGTYYQIDPNIQLLTPVHPLESTPRACSLGAADPITIGDNAWLDGGVIVCPGVTIGNNCVTGVGSVVTKDVPASSLAADNPARVLRQLDDSTFSPHHQHPPQETPQ